MEKKLDTENASATKKKISKKKLALLIGIAAAAVIAGVILAIILSGGRNGENNVVEGDGQYVDIATVNYYNGVVEPQQTWDIQKDAERQVAEIYVKVGDTVTVGQELFAYDTSALSMQVRQAQLELDGIKNEIDGYNSQINELTEQRANAPAEQQLEYTMQIQELQNNQKQAQLNQQMKQLEIDNLNKSAGSSVVTSTMDGVVKQINDGYSMENPVFMTILATGSCQVKGTVDEQNVWTLSEGMAVRVHSRVDEEKIWNGTITKIDTENTATQQNDFYYGGGMPAEQATKYYFYVALTTTDSLLLGQHVYIEPIFEEPAVMMDLPPEEITDEAVAGGEQQ